jgi:hypothetical protein
MVVSVVLKMLNSAFSTTKYFLSAYLRMLKSIATISTTENTLPKLSDVVCIDDGIKKDITKLQLLTLL